PCPFWEDFVTMGALFVVPAPPLEFPAALFRAAALIPGVVVVRPATDAIGRPGVAVALTYDGVRSEWIFSRRSLRWLGERDVSVATGKVTGESAILKAGFVNRPGQIPPG
ncbi:MAG: hypothetical protein ACR2FU_17295, partial [Streptosporangiaceae bacterium]